MIQAHFVSRQELRELLGADRACLRTLLGDDPTVDFPTCWCAVRWYRLGPRAVLTRSLAAEHVALAVTPTRAANDAMR